MYPGHRWEDYDIVDPRRHEKGQYECKRRVELPVSVRLAEGVSRTGPVLYRKVAARPARANGIVFFSSRAVRTRSIRQSNQTNFFLVMIIESSSADTLFAKNKNEISSRPKPK